MDKDKSGILDFDDIKGVYNGKKHPDVISGKKTEEEVLGEFLDTFEAHYALNVCFPSLPISFIYFKYSMRIAETERSQWTSG